MGKKPDKSKRAFFSPFKDVAGELRKLVQKADTPEPKIVSDLPSRRDCTDEELFLNAVSDVAPLRGRDRVLLRKNGVKEKRNTCPVPEDVEASMLLSQLVTGDKPMELHHSEEYVSWASNELPPHHFANLKLGKFSVQGHLDLHGLSTFEAEQEVSRFIIESFSMGRRCVLVVHGRGLNSENSEPVLKKHLLTWLRRGACGRKVVAYASALGYDGGLGAIYVLLRASKDSRW